MKLAHDWSPAEVPDNVEVGEGAYVHSALCFQHCMSTRPHAVRVGANAGLYDDVSFDLGPDGEVDIGEYSLLYGGKFNTNARIVVGSFTMISYETYLADTFDAVPHVDATFRSGTSRPPETVIEVGELCWIGARATILGGARLGEGVIVGAGAVVDFEVPPYAVVAGNPGRIVGSAPPRAPRHPLTRPTRV